MYADTYDGLGAVTAQDFITMASSKGIQISGVKHTVEIPLLVSLDTVPGPFWHPEPFTTQGV
jgi:hypothetical protein